MLSSLHIRNLAVVASADLEFRDGFSVLTGETGAGKSILVDALALSLGARAEARLVRSDAQRTEITAVFDGARLPQAAREWLEAQALDSDDDCVVRRIVTAEGRSRGFINGQPASMQSLRELGERLLDLCGQQAHLHLRHRTAQRELLDRFGGCGELVDQMTTAHAGWRAAVEALEGHEAAQRDGLQRAELLQFQCRELEALDLQPGEFAELEQQHRVLAATQQIESGLHEALAALYDAEDGSAQQVIARSEQRLSELADTDPALAPAVRLLGEAGVLVSEAAVALRERLGSLDHDPAREAEVAQRLADARTLARKHRVEPDELAPLLQRLAGELEAIQFGDARRAELAAESARREDALLKAAGALTGARREAATALSREVSAQMQALGMPGGQFTVALQELPQPLPAAYGAEAVEFMVAANPGQAAGPLASVASGGELSRISLALQVAVRDRAQDATLVFDEVDSGVGGGVAEMVGRQLAALGRRGQVLCVTHLPQVASQADQHFRVSKHTDGKQTATDVKPLDAAERVEELARMLGGMKITARTREHAREMLAAAEVSEAG